MANDAAPAQVKRALTVAAAASALAGHEVSTFAQETTRRRLMGELTSEEAVKLIHAHALSKR